MDENIVNDAVNEAAEASDKNNSADGDKKNKNKKKESFSDKLSALWEDKRSLKTRLNYSLLAALAFVFTFFLFGPIELFASNSGFFAFSFTDLFIPLIISGILIFAVTAGILTLLKGKIFNYGVSLLFALTFAGYVQGNFLNIDHGSLDGSEIVWESFKTPAFLGLLFWVAAVVAVIAVRYFSVKLWKNVIKLGSVIIIGAQLVALVLIFSSNLKILSGDVSGGGFLTKDGMFEVSEGNNVVVFLLDRFDKRYAERAMNEDPEIEKKLSGFTFYENFTGSYSRTCPAVTYLLTGVKCDYRIPMSDYFKKAWTEGKFLGDIKDAGFDTKIYTDINYVMEKSEYAADKITNMGGADKSSISKKILTAMYTLSAYRYLPEMMKPYFYIYTGDISYGYIYGDSEIDVYSVDDIIFRKEMTEKQISVDKDSKGGFTFYHLQGSHDPFVMDEHGNKMEGQTYSKFGQTQQTIGNMRTILLYIDMLKEKGLYDNTTIIITADHARTGGISELRADDNVAYEIGGERVLTLMIKPAGADSDEPMKRSGKQICQDNLRASMISYFGLDTSDYGRTIEDIGEDEEMTRYFWMSGVDGGRRDGNLITYEIKGDANDFSNWKKLSTEKIKYPYYDANK